MPAPGDQHTTWANPFEEQQQKVSQWSAQEIATISSRLDKQLGPEYISARSGPGGHKMHYLTAEKCIALANEVFGFNGWSSSIQNIQVDFADENPQTQRVSIGLSVIVRVTLRDGTYHEDIGYGSIENAKGKAMAFEKAKKEGTTDGLKRALRNFGNVLGNCIYDQDYVKQVVKIKAQPVRRFDPDNLHRHSAFIKKDMPVPKEEPITTVGAPGPMPKLEAGESFEDFLGELDEADFCVPEDGHPDEIMLPDTTNIPKPPTMQTAESQQSRTFSGAPTGRPPHTPNQTHSKPAQTAGGPGPQNSRVQQQSASNASSQGAPGAADAPPETVGFFSAKAVNQLNDPNVQGQGKNSLGAPGAQHLFNPKAESPSIRKTPGIDHSSSKPVSRSGQHVPPSSSQASATAGPASNVNSFTPVRPSAGGPMANRVNPTLDHTRRIGAPGAPGSPLSNRSSFRQPTMKRPPPGEGGNARPALADIPNNSNTNPSTATAGDALDAKRQRVN